MLRKGDKTPFTIRTVLVMLVVYISLMLAATWCVQQIYCKSIDTNEIWNDIRSDLRNCRTTAVDSAAYEDGFNQAQALAVARYHKYRLYRQYRKYDGKVDVQLYHCTVKDDTITSVEKLTPNTPVLIGAPYNRNSPIVVFSDSFSPENVEKICTMISTGSIHSYIDYVEGYQDGRFFYPEVMTIYDVESEKVTTFQGKTHKHGKRIKEGYLQDFKVYLPDGSCYGDYGLEEKMDPDFERECDKRFREEAQGESFSDGGFNSKVDVRVIGLSASESALAKYYALNVQVTFNPWLYAFSNLKILYILSLLLMIIFTAILVAGHNSVIEDRFESERKRRLMMDSMAHDMKTPLSIIRNFGELLLEGGTPAKQKEYAQTIIDESERMNDAVVSLLDLSKMEAGTYPMDLNDFHIREVIEEMVSRYEVLFAKKNMSAAIDAPQDLRMFADRKLITRALSNFISNGIHNSKPGTEMVISAIKLSNAVRIQVHNSGQHLDNDTMQHIWEAYYQHIPGLNNEVDGTQASEPSGSGLGLAIVRNICLLHGGSYGCENDDDGVTFWMQISSQEDRIGKMDVLTGPVTGVTAGENPVKGVGFIALGTLIQGFFWTLYFYGSFVALIPCLFDSDCDKVTIITDTIGLASAGIGAAFILYGTIQLQKRGWPVRNNKKADICQMIIIGLTMVLSIVIILMNGEHGSATNLLDLICLIAETVISMSMAVILLSHYRMLSGIANQLGMLRRSKNMQRQMLLMTVSLILFIGVALSGIAMSLPYMFMGSIWLLVCAFSAFFWIIASRGMTSFGRETMEFGQFHKMAGRAYLGVAICLILTEMAFFGWYSQDTVIGLVFTIAFAVAGCICFVLTLYFNHLDNKVRRQARNS